MFNKELGKFLFLASCEGTYIEVRNPPISSYSHIKTMALFCYHLPKFGITLQEVTNDIVTFLS